MLQKCQPASMRLVDNEQFILGQALKLAPDSYFQSFGDKVKKLYVTKWKRYNPEHMCAATLVLEGSKEVCYSVRECIK
jgi:alkyldihydroxyacetonephosphate synthase